MAGNAKIIEDLSNRAATDSDLLQNLVSDPVKTVQGIYPTVSEADAREISIKSVDKAHTIADPDMRKLFWQMINNSISAFKKTIVLNQVIFWTGIILLAVTFGFEIYGRVVGNETWQNVATTGVMGTIGVGTVVTSFIFKPVTAMLESAGQLSQIEIAFLSFIDKRDLLSNSPEPKTTDEAIKMSDAYQKAASDTMTLIKTYCENPESDSNKQENKTPQAKPKDPQPQ